MTGSVATTSSNAVAQLIFAGDTVNRTYGLCDGLSGK